MNAKSLVRSIAVIVSFWVTGCGSGFTPNVSTSTDEASKGSGTTISADPALQAAALDALEFHCAACHGATGSGGVSNITDVQHLVNSGLITAGDPSAGRIVGSIEDGSMPPSGPIPTGDLQAIKDWIATITVNSGGPTPTPAPTATPDPTPTPAPQQLDATYSSISEKVLKPKCLACHSAALALGAVQLDSYAEVMKFVDKMLPANSQLYIATSATGTMPPVNSGYAKLSQTELNALLLWIQNGAKND